MAEKNDGTLERELGISRRDLLKRGAVVGGTLVWAAPVIQSLAPSALAGERNGTPLFACCFCYDGASPSDIDQAECSSDHNVFERASAEDCRKYCSERKYENFQWGTSPDPCGCNNDPQDGRTGCSGGCEGGVTGPTQPQ
jgi:hypothetical protein